MKKVSMCAVEYRQNTPVYESGYAPTNYSLNRLSGVYQNVRTIKLFSCTASRY